MSEEKKDACCGPNGKTCFNPKKMILAVIFGGFMFIAGMIFAKTFCPVVTTCPVAMSPAH